MKKNILVLIGEYKPNMSPNGKIISLINKELSKNYNIIILARRTEKKLLKEEFFENEYIYRINDYNQILHNDLQRRISIEKNKAKKQLYKAMLYLKRLLFWIPRALRFSSISNHYVKKIIRKIEFIKANKNIDYVLAGSAPHEEVVAASKWCEHNKIKLFVFQMDRFVNANSLYPFRLTKRIQCKNNLKIESRVLNIVNTLFILPPLFEYYNKDRLLDKLKKIVVLEHPLVYENETYDIPLKKDSNYLVVSYAGSLDKKLRNPKYILDLFTNEIIKKNNIQLKMYSFGNCEDMISNYSKNNPKTIFQIGKVDSNIVSKKLYESDFLLTIGNNSNNEIPSKLFEYLSYGKPIIHFYYIDNDKYLDYLKKYPLSICLKMDKNLLEQNVIEFVEFCLNNKNNHISNKVVVEIYKKCTPTFVATEIEERIGDYIE